MRRAIVWMTIVTLVWTSSAASASPDSPLVKPRRTGDATQLHGAPTVTDKHRKLDSRLAHITRVQRERGAAAALEESRAAGLIVSGQSARVIVETADGVAARATIVAAGGTLEAAYADLVQASVPLAALEGLAAAGPVRFVRPPFRREAVAIAGEGVAATGASGWHADGITGAGTRVGVIDLGFGGYPARQATGDLPSTLTAVDLCSGQLSGPEVHGTAVAEIVHEMAPGAELFLICIETEVQLGLAKDYALTHGIHVVNHSVGWFGTSRGDGSGGPGTPDGIVAAARAGGILWVNAAGNHAQQHWNGSFADADGDGWTEWVPGDETNDVFLLAGLQFCASLKWDDWPVSSNDYDLYLFNAALVSVASSTNAQPPLAPTEEFCYLPPTTGFYAVAFRRIAATAAPRFDLFVNNGFSLQYAVAAGSIVEPASSPNAMAVGAICWQSSELEFFSSLGPTIDGRIKPDIAGPDGVSSATYGPFLLACGLSGFSGTSAAAPHVAGAAALVKQANAGFGATALQTFLEGRAVDLGPPGRDNSYGAGKLSLGAAPAVGGRGFRLTTVPPNASMSWTGGTAQTGYVIVRYSPAGASLLPSDGSTIPAGATIFTDTAVPSGFACYVLVALGTGGAPLALSDGLCLAPGVQSGIVPGAFTVRLDQSTNATLAWTAPGTQTGYRLVPIYAGAPVDLPGTATTVTVPLGAASNCYVLLALSGTAVIGWTDALCGIAGVTTFVSGGAPPTIGAARDALTERLRPSDPAPAGR